MLPLSTGNTNGCTPISSNCIVWQGPDLACLNICTGDTISVVVAKMAELLCSLIQTGLDNSFDISGVIQSCTAVGSNPPATDLTSLLQNIINVECNLQNTVADVVENYNLIQNYFEEIQVIQGPNGNDGFDGVDGQSVIDTIDNGDGTFVFVYGDSDGNITGYSDVIEVPTNTITNEINNETTITNTNTVNAFVKLPKCFLRALGPLYNNATQPATLMQDFEPMWLTTENPQAYYEVIGTDANGVELLQYYNGWMELVTNKLCCLLPCERVDDDIDDGRNPVDPEDPRQPRISDRAIQRLPFITQLKNRVLAIEKKNGTRYIPPKVTVKCVIPNKIGKRVEMQELLSALEKDYCNYRKSIGSTADVLTAARLECANLSGGKRLSGNGVMSTLQGWNTKPSNLAQSFSNAWKTICDLRTAVEDLQGTVSPTACTGFVYDPKISLQKNGSGEISGIGVLFDLCTIPKGYYDCDKGRGTKIVVEDSSLNTLVSYANVSQLQGSTNGHNISFNTTSIDTTSNFKVKFYFCFTDGSNQCERIMDMTLENTSTCPTITLTSTGETSIEYSIAGLNTNSNSIYDIIVEDSTGNLISKQQIKDPTSTSSSGKASSLIAGTKYNIYAQVTSSTGNISTCAKSEFITTAPTCTTYSKLSTEYLTAISKLSTTKTVMATYKDGATITAWIAGFDSVTGLPTVYKGTDSSETGGDVDLTFIKKTKSISDNPTTSISCGNVVYSATGMSTSMNSNENGWQYVDALTANGSTTYYIYALINTSKKSIDQVVFCCDCKPSYVRARYGKILNDDGTINPNSRAYRPEKHSYYVNSGGNLRIPIDIVGYSKQTTPITWDATATNGGTTKFYLPADTNYDPMLGGDVQFIYTPNAQRPTAGMDSVDIYAKTDCTIGNEGNRTVNTITIPIQDAAPIKNKDTDITVFIDTNVFTLAEANILKDELESSKHQIQALCSDWSGTINYVPVKGSNSGDYLNYTKAMVDMQGGASGSITVASSYSSMYSLPAYWSAGTTLGIPSTVYIIAFIGDTNLNGNYGSSALANGWNSPSQPTPAYQKNYDELCDILNTHGGAARSVWGVTQNCTYKKFDLTQILVPVVSGSQDTSAAAVLQTMGALTGTVLNNAALKGLSTGSVQNPVNLTDYMGPNASMMVPYNGTTSYGANTITGLYEHGFRVASFIDKSYLSTDSNIQSSGDQSSWIIDLVTSVTAVDTAGLGLLQDINCPKGEDVMKPMKGTLNGVDSVIYGEGATCATAGNAGRSSGTCIPIYNSTGVMFDSSVKAYKTIAGGDYGSTSSELTDTKWYAQNGSPSTDKVRRVAQYNSSGVGGYWINAKYVADASCT